MTRIVLSPSAYLPALGGVEELTRHLALTLVAAGDVVEIWTGTDQADGKPTVESIDGLVVRRFPMPLPAKNLSSILRLPLGIKGTLHEMQKALDSFRPDLIHVQCFGPNGIYATLLARRTGLPCIVTLQGETVMDDHKIFDTSLAMRVGLRSGLRRAAAVTGCSQFALSDAEQRFGLDDGRGRVIFNGVDLSITPTDPEAHPPPFSGQRYVVALGRVVPNKGFDLLLRAFALVAGSQPGVDLVIAGDGSALPSLKGLAEELGLSGRVQFPGRLSRLEVAAAMASAEIVVMPSRVEPFGIVALEAWRSGRPIVATSHGGPKEFIRDGEDGVLIDPFDQPSVAAALNGLLSDNVAGAAMGAAGNARVEEFDWPVIATQYRSLYAEVLRATSH